MVSSKQVYGLTAPFVSVFPDPITKTSAPTANDKNYPNGFVWIYKNGDTRTAYTYGGLDSSGDAVWILAGPGDSDVDTLTGDSGGAISPAAGNITLAGGTNITSAGSGSTITFNMDAAITLATSVTSALYTTAAGSDLLLTGVSGQDVVMKLGDAAGATKFSITDSGDSEVFSVDSNGVIAFTNLSNTGTFTTSGGTASINASSNFNTVINSGTSSGTVTVGNSAAGAITVDSGAGVSIDGATASNFTVTGASENLTLSSAGGSVVVSATEDAASAISLTANGGTSETIVLTASQGTGVDSITLDSTAGGITLSAALVSADAINLAASAGGVDIDGALQVNIASSQNAADAVRINASAGGIDIDAAGAAGEDITIDNAAGSVNVTAGEAIADSIVLSSTNGGIDILAPGAGAGLDIDIVNTGGSVNIQATEADANAIVINASNAGGGINCDSGTAGTAIDSTGAVSLDAAAASNFSVTGAGIDLTLDSAAGRVIVNGEEAAANAITLLSAAGGIDADAALQINIASSQNAADAIVINSSAGGMDITAAGAAGEDLDITCTAGSLTLTAGESAADAIVIDASGAAGAIQLNSGTGGLVMGSGQTVNATSVNNAASPYTVLGSDFLLTVDTSGGGVTLTLPGSPATGAKYVVVDAGGSATANNITISGNGNNIAGSGTLAATDVIDSNYGTMTLYFNGTFWNAQDVA